MNTHAKLISIFIYGFVLIKCTTLKAQIIRNYCLEVSTTSRDYNSTYSIIDFKWPYRAPTVQDQRVFRKAKEAYTWDTVYHYIPITDSTFSDTILTGSSYEYRFEKDTAYDGSMILGYVYAGHRVPAITDRGKILLIIDSTNKAFLDTSIRTFRNDLTGDGWKTEVKWFSPSTTVSEIKTYIVNTYKADSFNVKSVVLIGDLAVPYSGDFKASGEYPPDGHVFFTPPSHEGAWPADCYYGDVYSSSWTDTGTNNAGARVANRNNPGDGKFDQTFLPNLLKLQVGRIDLSGMTSFSKTERELLKQYFTKNHNFKHKLVNIRERCLIDDNFGLLNNPYPYWDEAFGNNAYRNMAPLINATCTKSVDYLSTLDTADYLWSFGLGNGGYTSCTGIGNTANFSARSVKSVFSGFFGSFFGDWDNGDNLLRAPLASGGNVLNTFWCGRPHWFFHHMGLGETIGYSAFRTQNNFDTVIVTNYLYPTVAASYLQIHVALMGDPSVRMQPVETVSNLIAIQDSCTTRFKLKWNAPSDTAVHNYYVFRANHIDSAFTLLGITPNLNYTDATPLIGNNVYMVRSSKLQFSGSGTYFNLGQGIFDTISTLDFYQPVANAGRDTSICKNNYLRIGVASNNSIHTTYSWIPVSFNRDTTTIKAIATGNRILFATDTISKCIQKDTMVLTAIALPVSESLTGISSSTCGDTATWSSTLINGGGFNYSWFFGSGIPNTLSGHILNNPGMVAYSASGNSLTILKVRDTLTQCVHSDTNLYLVNCLYSLPLADFDFKCENTHEGQTLVNFTNHAEYSFSGYLIEGLNEDSKWIQLKVYNGQDIQINKFSVLSDIYKKIRLSGVKAGGEKLVLDICNSVYKDNSNFVHPIPVENVLNINCNYYPHYSITYHVYNSLGQEIILPVISDHNQIIRLDTLQLAKGNYIIVLMVDDEIKQLKFNKI